ncbi:hypothetical protein EB796_024364 [Bugula neritina]|uniref:Uncharacterized protein n=1 Tax=Bugula neritina TaxID=10212 RepID=A0A7J7IUR5_BUGNE|nr:hypothetical protein EB796_024364 [Bugula neritina]
MRTLFQDAHLPYDVSHETYHNLLYGNFNISFGYPRKDTCSTCDELVLKIRYAELKAAEGSGDDQQQYKNIKILSQSMISINDGLRYSTSENDNGGDVSNIVR